MRVEKYKEPGVSGKKYLKNLHGAKRLRYLWDYYKIVPVLVIIAAFLVLTGFRMYRNAAADPFLDIVVLDTEPDAAASLADYGKRLSKKLDPDHAFDDIFFDWSINTDANDGEAMYREKLAVAVDQDVDLIVCGQDVIDEYKNEGIFADWGEILGNQAPRYRQYMTNGYIDIAKSAKWTALHATPDSPAYLVMKTNSGNADHVLAFLQYFFP